MVFNQDCVKVCFPAMYVSRPRTSSLLSITSLIATDEVVHNCIKMQSPCTLIARVAA